MRPAPTLTTTLWLACSGLTILLPLAWALALAAALVDPSVVVDWAPQARLDRPPSVVSILAALACHLPGLLALLWALVEGRALFARYRRGEALTFACAAHIRRIGVALLAVTVLSVLGQTASILVLTLGEPVGERLLAISLSSAHLGTLLIAGFVTVIGHVMAEAARLADENAGFV